MPGSDSDVREASALNNSLDNIAISQGSNQGGHDGNDGYGDQDDHDSNDGSGNQGDHDGNDGSGDQDDHDNNDGSGDES